MYIQFEFRFAILTYVGFCCYDLLLLRRLCVCVHMYICIYKLCSDLRYKLMSGTASTTWLLVRRLCVLVYVYMCTYMQIEIQSAILAYFEYCLYDLLLRFRRLCVCAYFSVCSFVSTCIQIQSRLVKSVRVSVRVGY